MKKLHLPKSFLFFLSLVILILIILLNLKNKSQTNTTNQTSLTAIQNQTITPAYQAKIYTRIITSEQNQTQLELVYQPKEPQTLSAVASQINFEFYQPKSSSLEPFALNSDLKNWQAAVNTWSCQTNQSCQAKIGLLAIQPGGFTVDKEIVLAIISFPAGTPADQLQNTLDLSLTQALTQGGKSVTIIKE